MSKRKAADSPSSRRLPSPPTVVIGASIPCNDLAERLATIYAIAISRASDIEEREREAEDFSAARSGQAPSLPCTSVESALDPSDGLTKGVI